MKLNKLLAILSVVPFVCLVIYAVCAATLAYDPDSRFCVYQIYRQPDGTYQVWRDRRSVRHCELKGVTFEAARKYQVEQCEAFKKFMLASPTGKRVTQP